MIRKRKRNVGMVLVVGVLLVLLLIPFISAPYRRTGTQYTQPGIGTFRYLGQQGIDVYPVLDKEKCGAGQDFLIQVAPSGCTPAVVRSDLLEEQNIPVFCPLMATKLNPLIDVEAINYMSFKGQKPPEVSGVGFHPSQSAIKSTYKEMLNSPVMDNIGYAVIVLKKQEESELTNCEESALGGEVCWVEGTMTADLKYDIKDAMGVGQATFYLPILDDSEWSENFEQYGFWKGKGFLRADAIDENGAIISVYRDENHEISTVNLLKGGDPSHMIYIPGYYCLAGMQLRLEGLDVPDTRARLKVDGDYYEVGKGEYFLDNKCRVVNLEKQGIGQKVTIDCRDDDRTGRFDLRIDPKIVLNVDGDEKIVKVGERIGDSNDANKDIYLGSAHIEGNTGKLEDLVVYFVNAPLHSKSLSNSDISAVYSVVKQFRYNHMTGENFIDIPANLLKLYAGAGTVLYKWIMEGETFKFLLPKESTKNIWGKKISIVGFAEPFDEEWNNEFRQAFEKAETDYRQIIEQFPEEETGGKKYAEKGLLELIELANYAEQKKTMVELCKEFLEKYPESEYSKTVEGYLNDDLKNANSGIASKDLVIDGRLKSISFEEIVEPNYENYGADILISGAEDSDYNGDRKMTKGEIIYLSNETEFFELTKVKENYIEIEAYLKKEEFTKTSSPKKYKINLNDYVVLEGKKNYKISLSNINLKKYAKVKVLPNIHYVGTEANFSFKIGIEKRAIQLSPDKIQSRIKNLDEKITKWEENSEELTKVVKGLKAACLGVGTGLTLKNILFNAGGKSIARSKVMRGEGGWNDKCSQMVNNGDYYSMNDCFNENAKQIDADVKKVAEKIDSINEDLEDYQDEVGFDRDFFGQKSIKDESKLIEKFANSVKKDLPESFEDFDMQEIENALTVEGWNANNFYTEDLRNIKLYSQMINDDSLSSETRESAKKELKSLFLDLQTASKNFREQKNFEAETQMGDNSWVGSFSKELRQVKVRNPLTYENSKYANYYVMEDNIGSEEYVFAFKDSGTGEEYLFVYDEDGVVRQTYSIGEDSLEMTDFETQNPFDVYFKKIDSSSYKNKMLDSAEVRYYETEPYKGYPSVVPFDKKNGWYVKVKQTLPAFGSIGSYKDSAQLGSFYLCNVGTNGRIEFDSGMGDDDCEMIRSGSVRKGSFGEEDIGKLVKQAESAIAQAQKAYKSGVRKVRIGNHEFKVGEPAANIPDIQCQDFMSPKECHLLFNVCDPVICPSSRCDLGGNYAVKDVIQTGIIGGIALCFPNYQEGIYIPVCLTGVQQGIEGLLSMAKSYRDCLQESLETGKQIGICDEISSIYLCEFMWRQITPFAKTIVPKIIEIFSGRGTKGGGEYLTISHAWENAENSVDYMKNTYALNSYNAFKIRSTKDIGTPVCKNFVSWVAPNGGSFIDALTEPDSPVQYTGWFDEIPFSSATSPPISHYKVFYHIYAGKDIGSYFKVYLRDPPISSLYDSRDILIASGYIGRGDYATETKDFTAPSGYQKLCIMVNSQEECGFQRVSTDFALDYLENRYLEEQASQTQISSEKECIAGKSSWYSMANLNIQEGADEMLNPEIYNRGLTRVCATQSPGKATDVKDGTPEARWVQVGYCDDKNIKCWLDKESVRDTIDIRYLEENALNETAEDYIRGIRSDYIGDAKYKEKIREIKDSVGEEVKEGEELKKDVLKNAIDKIKEIFDKVIMSNKKVQLLDFEARAWNKLARLVVKDLKDKETEPEEESGDKTTVDEKREEEIRISKLKDCQKEIGYKIKKLALRKKNDLSPDIDDDLKNQGVAESFECLVLQIAMQESGLRHCKDESEACKTSCSKKVRNDYDKNSFGVMQINTEVHKNVNVNDFEDNVNYAIENVLIEGYNTYKNGKVFVVDDKTYTGWKAALRSYNGWGTGGDEYYVDNVINQKNSVGKLFPECAGKEVSAWDKSEIDEEIVFEFKDGVFHELYYKYSDGEWRISPDKKIWVKAERVANAEPFGKLSDKNVGFASQLKDKSYNQGLDLLIYRTLEDNEGWAVNPKLLTTNVKMDHKGIFTQKISYEAGEGVTGDDVDDKVYFKHENGVWLFSSNKKKWNSATTLKNKTFYEGARIIFGI